MRTVPVRARTAVTSVCLVAGCVALAASAPAADAPELASVLEHFDEAQLETQTLQASFVERREISLLAEPVVSRGDFYYTRPYHCLWEYTEPESRFFLITEDEMVAFFPEKQRAEELRIRQHHARLFRILGIGRSSEELRKFYDISLEPTSAVEGTYELVLEPNRKRLRKRMEEVRLWIDAERYVPRQMAFLEADGDSTVMTFENIRLNAEIDPARYHLEIPPGVERVDSLSGFMGSGS